MKRSDTCSPSLRAKRSNLSRILWIDVLLFLSVCSGLFAAELTPSEEAHTLYEMGKQYEADRDWERAYRHYKKAVELTGDVDSYSYRAAYTARQLGHTKEAQQLLQPTLTRATTSEEEGLAPWMLQGLLLLDQERYADAQEAFHRALRLQPTSSEPYYGLARCAEATWQGSEERDQESRLNALAFYQAYLGRASEGSQRNEAQARWYQLQYGAQGTALNQAMRVLATGKYNRAERMLIKLHPQLKEATYWLGIIAQHQNEHTQARTYWEQALPLPEAQLALAKQHMGRGEYELALPYLQAAQQHAPHLVEVKLALGRTFLELGDTVEARRWLRQVLEQAPQRPEALRIVN